jgi:hypothetical protein
MTNLELPQDEIRRYCARDDLSTFDPYDIWKTPVGYQIKDFYNRHRFLGLLPAAALTVFDLFINDRPRWFYRRQEYPIVRAWAALALLNIFERTSEPGVLDSARIHLDWLSEHSCQGYSGPCWGLGFEYAVSADFIYDANMPLTTMTPYPLEAFVRYSELTGDDRYLMVIRGIYKFFDTDVEIMEETDEYLVTSYAAMRDRRVINAVSYVMYSYSLMLRFLDAAEKRVAEEKIGKLYAYVVSKQGDDGSWAYSPDGRSFIDCFHSCIVLKNIIKTDALIALPGCRDVVERGYTYLKANFLVRKMGLVKRFSVKNKLSLMRFDLYDNAEMLNLSILMGDVDLMRLLDRGIATAFVSGSDIYSQIDCFGIRHNRNTLRWAVMPYLYVQTVARQ